MSLPTAEHWLTPNWHPHPAVHACITTRAGQHSPAPWQGFNLGLNCSDDATRVASARHHVKQCLQLDSIGWLTQVHGTDVVSLGQTQERSADASISRTALHACAILTADCLPVLLARQDGSAVAATHAGWRGLASDIIGNSARQLAPEGEAMSAWLGPAICQQCYQVGSDVYHAFLDHQPNHQNAFIADGSKHFRLSLVTAARQQLEALGIETTASNLCTACDNQQFYSYRKEQGLTGRFASLIWLA